MKKRVIALSIVLLLVLVVWMLQFDLKAISLAVFHWTQSLGPLGPVLFILCYMLLVILLLPTTVLTLGAGLLFGLAMGTICVVIGISIGSLIAFFIGRHWFGERFSRYILTHPKMRAVDTELVGEGFKVILLTRLTPMFPGKLSNYLFGVARFRPLDFFLATTIGVIPYTLLSVYVGQLAGSVAALESGALSRSPLAWAMIVSGVIAAGLLLYYLSRLVRQALSSSLANR